MIKIKNNQIKQFSDNGFGKLQVIEQNGEFHFIAIEIVEILGYSKKSEMTKTLNKDEKMKVHIQQSGKTRKKTIISESGLYRLINNSSKPEAKEFKKMIVSKVLPRVFNTYFHSSDAQSKPVVNVRQMAKIITENGFDIGRNDLFKWLRECGLCIKQGNSNLPTAYPKHVGLMESKESIKNDIDCPTTLITAKGKQYILDRFLKDKKAKTA